MQEKFGLLCHMRQVCSGRAAGLPRLCFELQVGGSGRNKLAGKNKRERRNRRCDLMQKETVQRRIKMAEEKRDLFERMAELMGCTYVSDLRYLDRKEKLRLAGIVSLIPDSDADLFQWNDALEYLTGAKVKQPDPASAKLALVTKLKSCENY